MEASGNSPSRCPRSHINHNSYLLLLEKTCSSENSKHPIFLGNPSGQAWIIEKDRRPEQSVNLSTEVRRTSRVPDSGWNSRNPC